MSTSTRDHWRLCSICKTPIQFNQRYQRCNVSTCNRNRTQLTFCSVACWEAHVPTLRHRDAWAVEETAPSQETWEAAQAAETPPPARPSAPQRPAVRAQTTTSQSAPGWRLVAPSGAREVTREPTTRAPTTTAELPPLADDVPMDVLIVASKLKNYIKARSGMRTSDGVMTALSDLVRALCDEAIRNAQADDRQTVLDRDFPTDWRPA